MKKQIVVELLILLMFFALLILSGALSYYKFFVQPNSYVIQFKDIDGITKGSPVRLMGINIGYVRNLKSKDKHVNAQILVTKKGVVIPNGTVARVEFYGLGGSKSIELMPPDEMGKTGIVTGTTIRLNDVAKEAVGIVEILETLEKYTKNLNKAGMQKFLERVKDLKDDDINDIGDKFGSIEDDITTKVENITQKQNEVTEKIIDINKNVEKINKFIKK